MEKYLTFSGHISVLQLGVLCGEGFVAQHVQRFDVVHVLLARVVLAVHVNWGGSFHSATATAF